MTKTLAHNALAAAMAPVIANAADLVLAARAAAGDGAAFETLMRHHNQLLFRTARSILKNDEEAEDAVQEAYLRAWRALSSWRGQSQLATWLVRIVSNEALGRSRRSAIPSLPLEEAMMDSSKENQTAFAEHPSRGPEAQLSNAQLRRLLEAGIDALPEGFRTVFVLRAVEDCSVEEVARMLEIPEATVRTRFFRARHLLQERLMEQAEDHLAQVFAFDGERCDRIVKKVLAKGAAEGLACAV